MKKWKHSYVGGNKKKFQELQWWSEVHYWNGSHTRCLREMCCWHQHCSGCSQTSRSHLSKSILAFTSAPINKLYCVNARLRKEECSVSQCCSLRWAWVTVWRKWWAIHSSVGTLRGRAGSYSYMQTLRWSSWSKWLTLTTRWLPWSRTRVSALLKSCDQTHIWCSTRKGSIRLSFSNTLKTMCTLPSVYYP